MSLTCVAPNLKHTKSQSERIVARSGLRLFHHKAVAIYERKHTRGGYADVSYVLSSSLRVQAVVVEPLDCGLPGFVILTSFHAFDSVVKRVGVSMATGKFELATLLTTPIEIPTVQLKLG